MILALTRFSSGRRLSFNKLAQIRHASDVVIPTHGRSDGLHTPRRVDIGEREVVGFGMNGLELYVDHWHYPFPAIRFKEDKGDIKPCREKEMGDWRKLTITEKKTLYRASFCQTFSEMLAKDHEGRFTFAMVLFFITVSLWGHYFTREFLSGYPPDSMLDEERVRKQIQRMIDLEVNPVEGLTSHYDYEKKQWKSVP